MSTWIRISVCIAHSVIVLSPVIRIFSCVDVKDTETTKNVVSSLLARWQKSHTKLVSRLDYHCKSAFNSSTVLSASVSCCVREGEECDWLDLSHLSWSLSLSRMHRAADGDDTSTLHRKKSEIIYYYISQKDDVRRDNEKSNFSQRWINHRIPRNRCAFPIFQNVKINKSENKIRSLHGRSWNYNKLFVWSVNKFSQFLTSWSSAFARLHQKKIHCNIDQNDSLSSARTTVMVRLRRSIIKYELL